MLKSLKNIVEFFSKYLNVCSYVEYLFVIILTNYNLLKAIHVRPELSTYVVRKTGVCLETDISALPVIGRVLKYGGFFMAYYRKEG